MPSFLLNPQGKWRLARGRAGGCISAQHLGCPWQEGESVSWVPLTGSPPSSTKHGPLRWAKTWGPGQFLRGSWNRLPLANSFPERHLWGILLLPPNFSGFLLIYQRRSKFPMSVLDLSKTHLLGCQGATPGSALVRYAS